MKNKNFDNRKRLSLKEALKVASAPTNVITHVLDNTDGTYSVMSHIVCEHCDYCNEQGDCRSCNNYIYIPKTFPIAKEDPYEYVGR